MASWSAGPLVLVLSACAPGLLYAPVAPERADEAALCAVNELAQRNYSVTRSPDVTRAVGTRSPPRSFLERLSAEYDDRITVAVPSGPDSARLLVVGPYRQERGSFFKYLFTGSAGGGRVAPDPRTRGEAREILGRCAPITPLGGSPLSCVADGKPLAAGELLRVTSTTRGELQGMAQALQGDTITLVRGTELLALPLPDVNSMQRLVPVPLYNARQPGIAIGGVIGGIIGVAVLGAVLSNSEPSLDALVWGPLVVAGSIALGAGMGAASAGREDPVWRWRKIPTATCRGLPPVGSSAATRTP